MIAMTCEQVTAERLPALMCLDTSGAPLFATREGHRLYDRWNDGLPQSGRDFRLPAIIEAFLGGAPGSRSAAQPVRLGHPDAAAASLRLRHPALPDLVVTVEPGGAVLGREPTGCLLVFSDGEPEAANEPESAERQQVLAQLTPSERKVALLVAEGLRNGEIAEQLQRSRRTIEYQLNAIYRKLDLVCRTQLVRVLIQAPALA